MYLQDGQLHEVVSPAAAALSARYPGMVALAPGETCALWAFAPSETLPGKAQAPQMPMRAVVIADLHGVARTEYYDSDGRLLREVNHHVIDQRPRETLDYNYAPDTGALVGSEDGSGRRTCSQVDATGRPTQITKYPAPGASGDAQPLITQLSYDRASVTDVIVDPASTSPYKAHVERQNGLVSSIAVQVDAESKQTTTFSYDHSSGTLPRSVTMPSGSVVKYDDFAANGPQTVTVGAGETDPLVTRILYDSLGRPQQRFRPNHVSGQQTFFDDSGLLKSSNVLETSGKWVNTRYQYNGSRSPSVIQSPLRTQFLQYDALGHAQWVSESADRAAPRSTCFNVTAEGRLASEWLPEGNLRNYYYDDSSHLVRVEQGFPATLPDWAKTCAAALHSAGMPVPPIGGRPPDLQVVKTITYDNAGNPSLVSDESGVTVQLVTDGFGRVIDVIDGEGNHRRRGFDTRGRVAWEAVYGPNPPPYGRPQAVDPKVPLDSMVEFDYDNLGRPVSIARWHFADGQPVLPGKLKVITKIQYDDPHNRMSIFVDGRSPTVRVFDGMGRLRAVTEPTQLTSTATYTEEGGLGDRVSWTFIAGDGGQRSQSIVYDDYGRLRRVLDGTGPNAAELARNDYDDFGRLQHQTLGDASRTDYQFDGFGQLLSMTELAAPKDRTLIYGWDGNGALSSVQVSDQPLVTYVRDGLARIASSTRPYGTTIQHFVGSSGRLHDVTDPFGTSHILGYDNAGRLKTDHAANAALPLGSGIDRIYEYTASGFMRRATISGNPLNPTNNSSVLLAYDSLGNTIRDDSSIAPITISTMYDPVGGAASTVLTSRSSGSTATISRHFDAGGRLHDVSIDNALIATFDREAGQGVIRFGAAGAVKSVPSFDYLGRQTGLDVQVGGASIANQNDGLGHDGLPRVRQRRFGAGQPLTDYYQMDGASRVVGENLLMPNQPAVLSGTDYTDAMAAPHISDPSQQGTSFRFYNYDAASNWTHRSDSSGTEAVDFKASNGLYQFAAFGRDSTGSQHVAWGYDAQGSVANIGADSYTHDVLGHLNSANSGSNSLKYGHDALGRRSWQHDSSTGLTTYLVWDGASVAAIGVGSDPSGFKIRVGGSGPDQHLALVDRFGAGEPTYLHQGPDGSVLAATTETGLREGYSYSAFGEPTFFDASGAPAVDRQGERVHASAIDNRFLYHGQLWDPELRSYSLRAREYRPDVARFLSMDPAGLAGGENPYSYVLGKALKWADPTGLSPSVAFDDDPSYPPGEKRIDENGWVMPWQPGHGACGYYCSEVRGTYQPPAQTAGVNRNWINAIYFHYDNFNTIYQRDVSAVQDPNLSAGRRLWAGLNVMADYIPALLENVGNGLLNIPHDMIVSANFTVDTLDNWNWNDPVDEQISRGAQVWGAAGSVFLGGMGAGGMVDGALGSTLGEGALLENPLENPLTSAPENGTFYVDPKGNVIPTPPGGRITGSPDGRFIQARDANGVETGVRIDGGHPAPGHPDPRAQVPHGHVPGVTNPDGTPWLPINQ